MTSVYHAIAFLFITQLGISNASSLSGLNFNNFTQSTEKKENGSSLV